MTKRLKTQGDLPTSGKDPSFIDTERSLEMQSKPEQTTSQTAPSKDAKKAEDQTRKTGPVYSDWAMI